MSKPTKVVLPLAQRHPEPAQGPHAAQAEDGTARAKAHKHRLDLVVGVVSRGEDVHVVAHHRVKHELIARVARHGLDRFAPAWARARRERWFAPGYAQARMERLEPSRRGASRMRHLRGVALEVVVHVEGYDRVGEVRRRHCRGGVGFLLVVDHPS